MRVPLFEGVRAVFWVSPNVGDLDPDASIIALRGMPRSLFEIKRLVDQAIGIQHEMNAQPPDVVQDEEALRTGTADIKVQHELVDLILQHRQAPPSPPHLI